jgi:hypothetical protein
MDNYYDLYHNGDLASENEDDEVSSAQLCDPIYSILSIEDYKELMNSEQPGILDWKDFPTNFEEIQNINVRFDFDGATRHAWETAKEEVTSIILNSRSNDLLCLSETEMPSTEKIFQLFFGKESRFANILMSKLKVDYATLVKWLHDTCMQAVYQISPTDL